MLIFTLVGLPRRGAESAVVKIIVVYDVCTFKASPVQSTIINFDYAAEGAAS